MVRETMRGLFQQEVIAGRHTLLPMSRKRQAGSVAGRAHTIFSWPRSVRAPSMTVRLSFRAWTLWLLGFPDRARTDIEGALTNSREVGFTRPP